MKKIFLAVAVAAVATMAVVSSASADVARYQTQSMTITAVQPEGAVGQWDERLDAHLQRRAEPVRRLVLGHRLACSGTLNGPSRHRDDHGPPRREHAVSFTATRSFDGVVYSLSNAPLDDSTVTLATSNPVVPWDLEFKVSATTNATSNYKNHGDYVSRRAAAPMRPIRASECPSTRGLGHLAVLRGRPEGRPRSCGGNLSGAQEPTTSCKTPTTGS